MRYPGIPNPMVSHRHPYPTRYHGTSPVRPVFSFPYVRSPHNVLQPSAFAGAAFSESDGIFRRPTIDGGGIFNRVLAGPSGLGALPLGITTQSVAVAGVSAVAGYVAVRLYLKRQKGRARA